MTKEIPLAEAHHIKFSGMESHEYMAEDGRRMQFKCRQLLGPVNTNSSDTTLTSLEPGSRIIFRPLSASALGGPLFQESKNFQYMTIDAIKFTYIHSCGGDTPGSFYMQYVADPTRPAYDVGENEVDHAATLGDMEWTSVNSDAVLVVKPQKTQVVYAQNEVQGNGNANGVPALSDARAQYQGQFALAVAENMAAGQLFGSVLVDYAVTFSGPMLSYEVEDLSDNYLNVQYNLGAGSNYSATAMNVKFYDGGLPPAASPFPNGQWANYNPDSLDYMVQLRFMGYVDADTVAPLQWRLSDEPEPRDFEYGQVFFGKLWCQDEVTSWTDGDTFLSLYDTIGGPSIFMCDSAIARTGALVFEVHLIPTA
jgi:hypothetical protein